MYSCNNNRRGTGWFDSYQSLWVIIILAIIIVWVHCSVNGNNNCCCNDCCNNCCC